MNRLFKNAAFPIILVIVLAYAVSTYLGSGSSSSAVRHDWSTMLRDLKDNQSSLQERIKQVETQKMALGRQVAELQRFKQQMLGQSVAEQAAVRAA